MSLNDPLMPVIPTKAPPTYRPLGGLGMAAVATVALACLVRVFDLGFSWYAYGAVDDYLNGGGDATYGEVVDLLTLGENLAPFLVIVWLAAPVMFVVWLWRARLNAELINPHEQHLARGWAIGGWICPIVNFWFPFRIVHDIWRVSRPAELTSAGRPVHWWWTAWVLYLIARIWLRAESRSEESVEALRGIAVAHTAAALLECVAGVLVIVVIRQITTWQKEPGTVTARV